MKGGFGQSPLWLNHGLGQMETWDANAIDLRAQRLAKVASLVWVLPHLDPEILKNYAPKQGRSAPLYSVADHNYLAEGTFTRKLFDELRREILALDPCITEEFLKLYVAYKAETNVVDIVPLSQRLRLSLNMPFSELHDPRAIAKDVSNLGIWGNGDVEVVLESFEQIPYLLGLIRQSLERQLGRSDFEA